MAKFLVKRQRLSSQSEDAHCENTTSDSPDQVIVSIHRLVLCASITIVIYVMDLRTLDVKIIHVLSVLYASKNCAMKVCRI
jgi:hypothetical protein